MKKIILYIYLISIIFLGIIIDTIVFIDYIFVNGFFIFEIFNKIFHPNSTFSIFQYNMFRVFFYMFFNIFLALSLKYGINLLFTTNYQIKNIILTLFYSIVMIIILIFGIYITISPKPF